MHRRLLNPLLVVALLVGAAGIGPDVPRQSDSRPREDAHGGAVRTASVYALVARNRTAGNRLTAWRCEIALASPAYRRELRRARPSRADLITLRLDHASASAQVVGARPDPSRTLPRARVVVTLRERIVTRDEQLTSETVNEVLLNHHRGIWLVTRWTLSADGRAR